MLLDGIFSGFNDLLQVVGLTLRVGNLCCVFDLLLGAEILDFGLELQFEYCGILACF